MTSSPPSVSSSFELLAPSVQRWVYDQRWTELRDAQEGAIPPILDGRDVIVSAATATGKTEAAFLPIASRLVGKISRSVDVLCVSPLKALINDQFDRLELFFSTLDIDVTRWHGDAPRSSKQRLIKEPKGVLLITPESLEALFVVHGPRMARLFSHLEYVVVDELHAFLGTERGRQLQSLLHRIEEATTRRVPRVGLSATLGDMSLASEFLRPGQGSEVVLATSRTGGQEVRLQVRAYERPKPKIGDGWKEDDPDHLVALGHHMIGALRGADNLVFTNRRSDVEQYADLLRRLSEEAGLTNEFWPHHGSLAADLRAHVERLLKERSQPVTAVCTTTLELGIDIGTVTSVAQIGAPPSVASLRQRLGRSGRRGDPAIMRIYLQETATDDDASLHDRLRVGLVQTLAQVRLLAQGWIEPPRTGALHLSTLIQQTLSLVAERGGVHVRAAHDTLCANGPFRAVDRDMFAAVLKSLASHDLIAPGGDKTMLLGVRGERMVNHQTFFTAFATPEEWHLEADGRPIGTLPLDHPVQPESHLIFAGRRWRVVTVDADKRIVDLTPARAGRVPTFLGSGEPVHDRVREEMREAYRGADVPSFIDDGAKRFLAEARQAYRALDLDRESVFDGGRGSLVFCWTGDIVMDTIATMLLARGLPASREGMTLMVAKAEPDEVRQALADLAAAPAPDPLTLAASVPNTRSARHDRYLTDELSAADYASRQLDVPGAMRALQSLV